ncbi:MAG: C40 family peptidase [Candidatus Wildermuthbacteria bacterium]|nr:C40 family peptidase [Candidatus Wildermuthbacteria bacterium]
MSIARTSTGLLAVQTARAFVARARYCFLEEECRPPELVNCFVFISCVFHAHGIALPQDLLGQLYAGKPIPFGEHAPGDLIFTQGRWGGYRDENRACFPVGHVGIITEHHTVIHASWRARRVVEDPLEKFLGPKFRGIYRVLE